MIRYNETFPTRAAAEEFKTRVYASYHPAGYGHQPDNQRDRGDLPGHRLPLLFLRLRHP